MIPALIACATDRNLGLSSPLLLMLLIDLVKVKANQSLTSEGTASGSTSLSSSSSSHNRLPEEEVPDLFPAPPFLPWEDFRWSNLWLKLGPLLVSASFDAITPVKAFTLLGDNGGAVVTVGSPASLDLPSFPPCSGEALLITMVCCFETSGWPFDRSLGLVEIELVLVLISELVTVLLVSPLCSPFCSLVLSVPIVLCKCVSQGCLCTLSWVFVSLEAAVDLFSSCKQAEFVVVVVVVERPSVFWFVDSELCSWMMTLTSLIETLCCCGCCCCWFWISFESLIGSLLFELITILFWSLERELLRSCSLERELFRSVTRWSERLLLLGDLPLASIWVTWSFMEANDVLDEPLLDLPTTHCCWEDKGEGVFVVATWWSESEPAILPVGDVFSDGWGCPFIFRVSSLSFGPAVARIWGVRHVSHTSTEGMFSETPLSFLPASPVEDRDDLSTSPWRQPGDDVTSLVTSPPQQKKRWILIFYPTSYDQKT